MKAMLKDALILLIITVIAGAALGFVYTITKEPIAISKEKAETKSFQEVFTDAASFAPIEGKNVDAGYESKFDGVSVDKALLAKDSSGNVLGYVLVLTSKEGYGGDITFSMGLQRDGTINGISILSISETAGLGMNADKVLKPQYAGKKVPEFTVTKVGAMSDSEIDAISGATITSKAVTKAVNAGLYYFQTTLGGGTYEN